MGTGPGNRQAGNPIMVLCPLCGAAPSEPCSAPDLDMIVDGNRGQIQTAITGRRQVPTHDVRKGEAHRRAVLDAPPTEDVGRWATLEERAGR